MIRCNDIASSKSVQVQILAYRSSSPEVRSRMESQYRDTELQARNMQPTRTIANIAPWLQNSHPAIDANPACHNVLGTRLFASMLIRAY